MSQGKIPLVPAAPKSESDLRKQTQTSFGVGLTNEIDEGRILPVASSSEPKGALKVPERKPL